ncbi:MAG: hypothetical protein WC629_00120 [Candidatus Paceibacterota bacterium]
MDSRIDGVDNSPAVVGSKSDEADNSFADTHAGVGSKSDGVDNSPAADTKYSRFRDTP